MKAARGFRRTALRRINRDIFGEGGGTIKGNSGLKGGRRMQVPSPSVQLSGIGHAQNIILNQLKKEGWGEKLRKKKRDEGGDVQEEVASTG